MIPSEQILLIVAAFINGLWLIQCGEDLSWENVQPERWKDEYPVCGRSHQSPINIDFQTVTEDYTMRPIQFIDYDEVPPAHQWKLENNGYSVRLSADFPCSPQLQGGSLHAKYSLVQVHFHWAHVDHYGSEHHLDGRRYPLEMHLVHLRRNKSPAERANDEIGYAVVAVFFELGNVANHQLTPITNALQLVQAAGTLRNVTLPDFTLKSILPHLPDFFRYNGSLTTPPCDATVQWSVMRQPIRVNANQLQAFRALRAFHPDRHDNLTEAPLIKDNFRPVQELGGRKVLRYRSYAKYETDKVTVESTAARRSQPLFFFLLFPLLILCILSTSTRFERTPLH